MTSNEPGPAQGTVQNTATPESLKRTLLKAITIELPKPQPSDSTVSVTLGNRRGTKTLKNGSSIINWEPEEAWEITTGSVLKVSFKTGGILSVPWSRPNKGSHDVEIDSNEILSESIIHDNQSVTEHGPDNTTVFERVFENKGLKMTVKFSILDEHRSQPALSPGPQQEPQLDQYPRIRTELELQLERHSSPQRHATYPDTQPDPLAELERAAEEAVKMESVRDRLQDSVVYLQGLLSIGDVVKGIHPAIGVSIRILTGVMKILETEDEIKKDIADLLISMSNIAIFVVDVKQFATVTQLREVINEANGLMNRALDLFNKHKGHGTLAKAFSAFSGKTQEEFEGLQTDLNKFRNMFDRGISIQTSTTGENLGPRLKDLERLFMGLTLTNEDEELLDTLDTKHGPRRLRCLDGTRKDLIMFILEWARDMTESARNILWIFGYPGAGKSTLAIHVAYLFRVAYRLGVIVEFNRNTGINAKVLWQTIAYGLACEYPECRNAIVSKLKSRTINLANATPREIFNQLVMEPLRQLTAPGSSVPRDRLPVIVIDALDECGALEGLSRIARKGILECFADWAKLAPGVKLIVTSRAEQDIMQVFENTPHTPLEIPTGTSVMSTSTHDIELYMRYEFKRIANINRIADDWPGDRTITDLAHRAQGVFIWATTVISFVDDIDPGLQLKTILSGRFPAGNLYKLYRQILETSFPPAYDSKDFVDVVAAIVVLQRPFMPTELIQLLGLEKGAVDGIRKGLRSVLGDGDALRFQHHSFVDFLTSGTKEPTDSPSDDQSACPERFRVNASEAHGRLCEFLFRLMHKELHFNICNFPSSFMRNEDLPQGHLDNAISPPLAYACRFWGFHLLNTKSELDAGLVDTFIRYHFLSWLEGLSGLQSLTDAVPSLITLEERLSSSRERSASLKVVVRDAIAFIWYLAQAIADSAPHVYTSALVFAPTSSIVAQLYAPRFKNIIRVEVGQLDGWPAEQSVIRGHSAWVEFVVFSPDGRRVISCSGDRTIRITDVVTGQLVAGPFKGHSDKVLCAVYSTDGKTVLSVSRDNTIRTWNAECGIVNGNGAIKHDTVMIDGIGDHVAFSHNRKFIASVQPKYTTSNNETVESGIFVRDVVMGQVVTGPIGGRVDRTNCIAFSPDDTCIASGSEDGRIRVWGTWTGELVTGPLKGDQHRIFSISYSHNGTSIASGGYDGTVRIWDVGRTPRQICVFKGHTGRVCCIAFTSDDRRVVSGSTDCTVLVSDVETGLVVAGPFQGHTNIVTSVAFSPDCKRIASGSLDSIVRIWDVEGDTKSGWLFDGDKHGICSIAFSKDSRRFVSGSIDGTIRIWDRETGELVQELLKGHEGAVYSVAYSPDGQRVVSSSEDGSVRVWDVARGETVIVLRGHQQNDRSATHSVSSASFRTKNRMQRKQRIYTATQLQPGSQGPGLDTRNPPTPADREPIMDILQCCAHEDSQWITAVAFSHDGSLVASGSRDTTIRIFSAKDLSRVFEPFRGHIAAITSLSFSLDDKFMASGSVDCFVRIWDMDQGQLHVTLPYAHVNSPVVFVSFLNNDKNVVSCSEDAEVRVWDVGFGVDRIDSHKRKSTPGMHLVFAFLGNLLVESCGCGLAHSYLTVDAVQWSWSKTKQFREGQHHEDYVTSVAISPDGKTVASGSKDSSVRLWTKDRGTFKHKWTAKSCVDSCTRGCPCMRNNWVMCVAFSSDSHYVISGSLDGTIQVWDAETGGRVGSLVQTDGQVLCVSTYGELVAWGTSKGTLQIRNLELQRDQVSGTARDDTSHTAGDNVRHAPVDKLTGSDNKSMPEDYRDTVSVYDGPDDSETSVRKIKVCSLAVAYSNSGRYIASASLDGTNRIWNAETGDCIHTLQVGDRHQVSIAFSPDDKSVVSNLEVGFRIWGVETGNLTIESRGVSGVYSVTFSRDGQLVATASVDGIHIWNATTGQLSLGPFQGHTRPVSSVAFSPDDNFIVSGSWDCTVRIWDTKTGQTVRGPFKGHTDIVNSVVFSHDGKFVISGSEDKTIRIWSTEQILCTSLFTGKTEIDEDGWARGEDGELLFWVPPRHRLSLRRPNNTRVIGPNETQLDFGNVRWGKDWTQCYTP